MNQVGEIICEGERSNIFVDPPSLLSRDLFLKDCSDIRHFMVPYTGIPRWLNSKHQDQSVGNSRSFGVDRKFPNVFAVYFAFGLGSQLPSYYIFFDVYLSINGCEKVRIYSFMLNRDATDTLGILSRSHHKLQKLLDESEPSHYNHVEVTYEWRRETDRNNPPCEIRRHTNTHTYSTSWTCFTYHQSCSKSSSWIKHVVSKGHLGFQNEADSIILKLAGFFLMSFKCQDDDTLYYPMVYHKFLRYIRFIFRFVSLSAPWAFGP
ncbi:hypothetical protein CMV_022016 [Castanea mollissima]|uniref:Uncharacterized protein n=1 Tax=Castanea mollissima TaxID=60419 RepID=A0A8J4QIQ1_9ROSI|nr:hypothetical protein CMV_022016 [Castanea mollissima]